MQSTHASDLYKKGQARSGHLWSYTGTGDGCTQRLLDPWLGRIPEVVGRYDLVIKSRELYSHILVGSMPQSRLLLVNHTHHSIVPECCRTLEHLNHHQP